MRILSNFHLLESHFNRLSSHDFKIFLAITKLFRSNETNQFNEAFHADVPIRFDDAEFPHNHFVNVDDNFAIVCRRRQLHQRIHSIFAISFRPNAVIDASLQIPIFVRRNLTDV